MSDQGAVIDTIGEIWERTDIPQTQFAELLRSEADLYEESPEEASSIHRLVPDQ